MFYIVGSWYRLNWQIISLGMLLNCVLSALKMFEIGLELKLFSFTWKNAWRDFTRRESIGFVPSSNYKFETPMLALETLNLLCDFWQSNMKLELFIVLVRLYSSFSSL